MKMKELRRFNINGQWVDPASTRERDLINPATEKKITAITLGSEQDVKRAVDAADAAFVTYSRTTKGECLSLLGKLLEIYQDRFEEMAQAITREMGAPVSMSRDAQAETGIRHLQSFIKAWPRRQCGRVRDHQTGHPGVGWQITESRVCRLW
jgi:aldehyde dehydrogenase (NAD+)